jgi:hypothetical protein
MKPEQDDVAADDGLGHSMSLEDPSVWQFDGLDGNGDQQYLQGPWSNGSNSVHRG